MNTNEKLKTILNSPFNEIKQGLSDKETIDQAYLRLRQLQADFYPTPEEATRSLLWVETFRGEVWEPACGDGAIAEILRRELTGPVTASDLYDYGYATTGVDFLKTEKVVENVVTNPPYRLASEFIRHALRLARKKVAFLLPVGNPALALDRQEPLRAVYVLPRAISNSLGWRLSGWHVWDHSHKGGEVVIHQL